MEKINTDYKRRNWKIWAELFKVHKPCSFTLERATACQCGEGLEKLLSSLNPASELYKDTTTFFLAAHFFFINIHVVKYSFSLSIYNNLGWQA